MRIKTVYSIPVENLSELLKTLDEYQNQQGEDGQQRVVVGLFVNSPTGAAPQGDATFPCPHCGENIRVSGV